MSSQNAFPGRPAARPTTQTSNGQPSWVHPQAQTGRPQQPANWPPQQQPAPSYPSFPQPGYGAQAPEQQPYGQWSELQPPGPGNHAGQADPYAPQFEPYVPPTRPNYGQQPAPAFGGQQQPQWPARGGDPRGFDAGNYSAPQPNQQPMHAAPTFGQQQYQENELSAADWAGSHDNFAHDSYQQGHGDPSLGFGQAEGGELEPAYSEEEGDYEYEEDAPRGRRRPLMILAALVGAIVIGGGMAYGYKKFTGGGGPQGDPPVIKSDDFASKTKPADAGGKQFPYSDTKIMGRLGDGTSSASADDSNNSSQSAPPDNSASSTNSDSSSSSADEGGARKVSTLVVGRDGTIQPPPAPAQDRQAQPSSGATGVPGTSLVDVFGQQGGGGPSPAADGPAGRPKPTNAEVTTPAKKIKPVKVAKINTINSADASSSSTDDSADASTSPPKKKLKKVARAEPTVETDATADAPPVAAATSSGGGAGFVAVLASVPHSASSRIDALKRFADMQQKYGTALAGKTPDIASANLSKGAYDRLVVGPPGSREEASNVCSQLKAQGYKDCWVTSY